MYGVAGGRRLPELELPWLAGYEGSAPVRNGNGAAQQRQLDVPGEEMYALHQARLAGIPADAQTWAMQRSLLDWPESSSREPENGSGGPRRDPRPLEHHNVMFEGGFER